MFQLKILRIKGSTSVGRQNRWWLEAGYIVTDLKSHSDNFFNLVVLYGPLAGMFGVVALGLADWGVILTGGAIGLVLTLSGAKIVLADDQKAAQ